MKTAKSASFVKEATPSLVSSVNGADEETEQNVEPIQNTSATETQTNQPNSKDILPDVSMDEDLKLKEVSRV